MLRIDLVWVGGCQLSNWELIDMGSLNGTLVNSRPAGAAQKANSTTRQRGLPTSLSNGDTITLGSSSNVLVSELEKTMFEMSFTYLWPCSIYKR